MRKQARWSQIIWVAGGFMVAGCHSYHVADTIPAGAVVRLRVPVESAASRPNAPPATIALEGLVLASGDTIVLEVTRRQAIGAYREFEMDERYRLPRDDVVSIEVRELSMKKSALLGTLITIAVTAAASFVLDIQGGEDGERPGRNGRRGIWDPVR